MLGATPMAQMGPGAAMLITVAAVFLFLILLERWQNRRRARRQAAQGAPTAQGAQGAPNAAPASSSAQEGARRVGLWGMLFGPAAGKEPPYDPMEDMHPDELEGVGDGDSPHRGGM